MYSTIYNLYWVRRHRFRIFSTAPIRKKPIPLHFGTRISDALALHKELNTAIAAGDKAWLREHCCSGLAKEVIGRIDRHSTTARNPEYWELVYYKGLFGADKIPPWPLSTIIPNKSYQVVNDLVGQLPVGGDTLMRQVTVRITSVQRCALKDAQGKIQDVEVKDLTEYIVLQKIIWNGEDEPWKIWGTVNPSTIQEIKDQVNEDKDAGGLADRIKAMLPSNMGTGGMM